MDFTVQAGQIGQIGKNVAVVGINLPPVLQRTDHTSLLLDCSASMADSIDDLRRDSQTYLDGLSDGDFVSIIIFSGHNQAELIAGPTQCNAAGKDLLKRVIQNKVRVLSTTVFSETLELCIATAQKLKAPGLVHNAVLFTDGCAVPTRWGVATEHSKSFEAARALRKMGVSMSVIGYGVYYDTEFINQLMEAAGNHGVYRHISEIDEFGPVIEQVRKTVIFTVLATIDLTFSPDKGKAGRVFKTTPQLFLSSEMGHIRATGLYEGKTTLFVELEGPCSTLTVSGSVDGQAVNETIKTEMLSDENAADFIRVLGAYAFLTGDRATAAQMLSLTEDEGLAEQAASAYTQREQRETGDLLRRVFVNRKFIGAGLKATGPSHCVLNVLRTLIEDEGNVVYIPKGTYKRSGELVRDARVIESPLGRTLRVMGYVSHDSRLNFSLKTQKDVKVRPENNGAGTPMDKKIWRTYNIILDGNLHLPELEAVLTERSFLSLKEAGVIDAETYDPSRAYKINLRNLKMISPNWANPATLGLIPLMREEKELKAEQTALNARKKAAGAPESSGEEGDIYTETAEKVEGIPVETYTAPSCEYRLMGYKARSYDCSTMTYEQADARIKEVRQRLVVVRFLIRAIVFSMELVGSKSIKWDSGQPIARGKDAKTKLEQTAVYLGAQLKRVTWDELVACS